MTGGDDGKTDELLEVIRQTRARYITGFPSRLDHLLALSDNPTPDQLDALRIAVHRMVGLSATLGFHAVGALAAELEKIAGAHTSTAAFNAEAARRVIHSMPAALARDRETPPAWAEPGLE